MATITDPTRIAEEFQGCLEGCFVDLEALGIPGTDEFRDKISGLHSEEREGFTLVEALTIIQEFEAGLAGTPDAYKAHPLLEGLRDLYEWVAGPIVFELK